MSRNEAGRRNHLESDMTVRTFVMLSALALAACGRDDGPPSSPDGAAGADVDYGARGRHGIGFTTLTDGELAVKLWYPTAEVATAEYTYMAPVRFFGPGGPDMPFFGEAVPDAAPHQEGGPYPLVVFSHGFGMTAEWYHQLGEHLATRGYVVMAPEHVEYDWFTDVIPATAQRPADVSQTLDLAATGLLDGIIDTDRVAVVGHSYGGTTALMSGGARFQMDWLEAQCAVNEDPFVAAFFCDTFLLGEDQLAAELGLETVPEGMWPSLADDRVDAIVAMAPDAGLFGEVGLSELSVPAMMLGGTGDTAAPWGWGGALAYDHISSETRAMVAFEGGEHFLVSTTCDRMPWTAELPAEFAEMFCADPAWDKDVALQLTHETVTAFLAYTLKGEAEGRAALQPTRYAGVEGLEVRFDQVPQGRR